MAKSKTMATLTGGATMRRASPKAPRQLLSLDKLETPGSMQSRGAMDADTIESYAGRMEFDAARRELTDPEGKAWPAVEVFLIEGDRHLVVDGFHRVAAARSAGLELVPCVVHKGSEHEALIHSLGVNARHGLPRTRADKRRAVVRALKEESLRCLTDSAIATICAVSNRFVGTVREELEVEGSIPIEPTLWHSQDREDFYERPDATIQARKKARDDKAAQDSPKKMRARASKANKRSLEEERISASIAFGEELEKDAFSGVSVLVAYPVHSKDWQQLIGWLHALSPTTQISSLIIPIPSGSRVLEDLSRHIQAIGELDYGLPHTLTIASHHETYFVFRLKEHTAKSSWVNNPIDLNIDPATLAFAGIILHDWGNS